LSIYIISFDIKPYTQVSSGSGSIGRVPTLDDFDKKISAYQAAFNTINSSPDESAIGWLFVDIKPIKQVLLTHASRWVYVFTEYLINQCTKMLGSIEEFLLDTEPQIETLIKTLSASPTDAAIAPAAYMKLVELFNKVQYLNRV
jgi:dynein heavy chain